MPVASFDELLCSSQRPMQLRQSAPGLASRRPHDRLMDERWPLSPAAHLLAQICRPYASVCTPCSEARAQLYAPEVERNSVLSVPVWELQETFRECSLPIACRIACVSHAVHVLCRRPSSSPHAADDAVLVGHPSGDGDAHGEPIWYTHLTPAPRHMSKTQLKSGVEHNRSYHE